LKESLPIPLISGIIKARGGGMDIEINLLGISILILIFAFLLMISSNEKKSATVKEPPRKEKRAYPRYKTSLRIKYESPLEEGISWIRDISKGGARLFLNNSLKTLKIGESLGIEINLPDDPQPIIVQGNIVWSKENDAGFNFDNVIQGNIDSVIRYINKEE
jgi:hypothetical protein